MTRPARAAVIGGGFYGCCIALHLAARGLAVTLFERESGLLTRASYINQARIHGGYHYPRSYNTAHRSQLHFQRFIDDWAPAILENFHAYYAIARNQSHISARQFVRFCRKIGAPIGPAPPEITRLFDENRIEAVFATAEAVFNAKRLRDIITAEVAKSSINLCLETSVIAVHSIPHGDLIIETGTAASGKADIVFNCTYSDIYAISGCPIPRTPLKHELVEMALLDLPPPLSNIGVTVMDGPFFSLMPFPSLELSTLSHVRYTPHSAWTDTGTNRPNTRLDSHGLQGHTRAPLMIRDAVRYLPCLRDARYHSSLFEIKTIMAHNEIDDGRPILFQASPGEEKIIFVLGSKIDNIYDALHAVDNVIHD